MTAPSPLWQSRAWDNFKATRRTIRAELEQAVRAANIANPDAIDNNALELMKTGVLSPADYSAFMERFDSRLACCASWSARKAVLYSLRASLKAVSSFRA
jgi:hypothetical protein